MLEKHIEAHLVKRVKEHGGIAYKFTSPQRRSVPDRLVLRNGMDNAVQRLKSLIDVAGFSGIYDRVEEVGRVRLEQEVRGIVADMVAFIELKAPGKHPTPLQLREHARLRELGFLVLVLDTKGAVDGAFPK